MGRGSQGQGTRDGSLPFEDQVAGEGEISSDSAFPSQRRAFETVCTTSRASALSGASLEKAAIDVSSPRPRMLREQVMRPPSAQCGVQGFPGWHQGEGRSNRHAHRDRVLNPLSARQVTAKFDIPGVAKEDMNVTYHPFPTRLEITWTTVEVSERESEECMTVREERTVCRTILLPEGTRVSFLSPSYAPFSHKRDVSHAVR